MSHKCDVKAAREFRKRNSLLSGVCARKKSLSFFRQICYSDNSEVCIYFIPKKVMELRSYKFIVCLLALLFLMGCAGKQENPGESSWEMSFSEAELPENPALPDILQPEASGVSVEKTDRAMIDYSNIADGYVMVRVTEETENRLKVQVKGPSTTYTYNIAAGGWETFPLSDGNGTYRVILLENVEGSKYAQIQSVTAEVTLADEFAPFLRPISTWTTGMPRRQ